MLYFGKRNPGGLTAASPGDTLYIPLNFFNDSGASIGIGSSLARTDIELFKDGSVTQRATDSGYAILGDTGNFDNRIGFKGISISLFNTADDASFYAVGSTYWVAIDSVTVDGRTVRFWPAVFEIGEPRANVVAFNDTGVNDRLARIQSDVDTGLRTHISDVDTGLHDTMSDYDTGIRALLALRDTGAIATAVWAGDTGLRDFITNVDTGLTNRLSIIGFDVDTGLRAHISDVDTGLHDTLADYDTGIRALLALRDTGAFATAVWAGDTGLRKTLADYDTGLRDHINNLDTGIADAVWNEPISGHQTAGTAGRTLTLAGSILGEFTLTGTPTSTVMGITGGSAVNDFYADLQVVITSGALAGQARPVLSYNGSTGDITVDEPFTSAPASGVTIAILAAHAHPVTQIASYVWDERDTGHADTGTYGRLSYRLSKVAADTDTGIQPLAAAGIADAVWDELDTGHLDTGTFGRLRPALAAVRAKTDSLTFTVAGVADTNIQYVNDVQVGGTGDTGVGTPWGPV